MILLGNFVFFLDQHVLEMELSSFLLTMNIYVKNVEDSQVAAMDALREKLGVCNDHATPKRIH